MSCPDPNALAVLAEGGEETSALREHLAGCAACRDTLEAIRAEIGDPEPPPKVEAALWEDTARALAPPRRRSWIPLAAAAGLLLCAGLWIRSRTGPTPPAVPPSQDLPSWLPSGSWTSTRDGEPVLLEGGIGAVAGPGTSLRTGPGVLHLDAGELALEVPKGAGLSLGSCARIESGRLWISAVEASRTGSLFRDAWAGGVPGLRLLLLEGKAFLKSADGSERPAAPGERMALQDGAWTSLGKDPSPRALALASALDAEAWSVTRGALPLKDGAWRLEGRASSACLGAGIPEGALTVRLRRPPAGSEVLLSFSGRAWVLGDWAARGFGAEAVLTVAFGPWGARGYANGRRAWAMDPKALATTLPASPEGGISGVRVSGSDVEILEARIWSPK